MRSDFFPSTRIKFSSQRAASMDSPGGVQTYHHVPGRKGEVNVCTKCLCAKAVRENPPETDIKTVQTVRQQQSRSFPNPNTDVNVEGSIPENRLALRQVMNGGRVSIRLTKTSSRKKLHVPTPE
jgi:hypothetical protein